MPPPRVLVVKGDIEPARHVLRKPLGSWLLVSLVVEDNRGSAHGCARHANAAEYNTMTAAQAAMPVLVISYRSKIRLSCLCLYRSPLQDGAVLHQPRPRSARDSSGGNPQQF